MPGRILIAGLRGSAGKTAKPIDDYIVSYDTSPSTA
jgi:hypothetical protein